MDTQDKALTLTKQLMGQIDFQTDDATITAITTVLALLIAKDAVANERPLEVTSYETNLIMARLREQISIFYKRLTDGEGGTLH